MKKYLEKQWAKRGSTNKCTVSMGHGGKCWVSDVNHPNYKAGRAATKMVYGIDPDLTREGKRTIRYQISTKWIDLDLREVQICRKIRGLGCVTRAQVHA